MLVRRNPEIRQLGRASHLKSSSAGEITASLCASPSEIIVDSDWLVEIRVRVATEESARAEAWSRLLPPVLAAITLQTGDSPHVELLRAAPEDDAGNVLDSGWSIWSDSAVMRRYGSIPEMTVEHRLSTTALAEDIRTDKVAMGSAADLAEATRLHVTNGGRASETAATLLRYFHVIERVSTKVAAHRPVASSETDRRGEVLQALALDLMRSKDVDFRARRVQNAALALSRADGARLAVDIEYAATVLGLDSTDAATAQRLNKLRNQQLAHPGKQLRLDGRSPSTELAKRTAVAFLRGYVRR